MISVILFNVIEIICTILIGILLNTKPATIAILLLTWSVIRMFVKDPMHYKSPVKCFVMTLLMFVSLFLATKVHLLIGILCVIFDNIILSKSGNVKDAIKDMADNMFQWNNSGNRRNSKYQELIDFVSNNYENPIVLQYEKYWRKNYSLRYEIFNMFFKDRMTYEQIIRAKGLNDNSVIKTECKIIYSILEMPLKLKPLE